MKFIFSTTGNIERGNIIRYIDVVCTNVIVGTNVFSDFAASFTDFFGGKSNSYKRKLDMIYNEAKKEIKHKAIQLGANCIIGFKVDFDEISGKDKSMFMISASGTACLVEYNEIELNINEEIVSQSEVDKELLKRSIINRLSELVVLKDNWIELLIEKHPKEAISPLIKSYNSKVGIEGHEDLCKKIEQIIRSYPKDEVIDIAYDEYISSAYSKGVFLIIQECNLFDSKKILQCIEQDVCKSIELLSVRSDYYNKSDISIMEEIVNRIYSIPNTGKIEMVKSGFISKKEEEMYICQNGHKNPKDSKYCNVCNLDIKGITKEQNNIIEDFKNRIDVIKSMIL